MKNVISIYPHLISAGFHPERSGVIYYIKLRGMASQKDMPGNALLSYTPWTNTFTHQFYNQTTFDVLFAYGLYATARALSEYFPDRITDNVTKWEELMKDRLKHVPGECIFFFLF
jgi:hypothetical protein